MKIYRKLLIKSRKNTASEWSNYFTALDEMPLFNWIKCNEGDLIYTRKEIDPNVPQSDLDRMAWDRLYDLYIRKYGLSKLYKKMLSLMREKALLECTFVETRDRFKLTEIELKETELSRALANNGNGMSIDQAVIHLSKWVGYRLDPKEISVAEYFVILDEYGKSNKTAGHS